MSAPVIEVGGRLYCAGCGRPVQNIASAVGCTGQHYEGEEGE